MADFASRVNGATLLSNATQEVGQKEEQSGPNLPGGHIVNTCTPFKIEEYVSFKPGPIAAAISELGLPFKVSGSVK
jgi:hypothetical protein